MTQPKKDNHTGPMSNVVDRNINALINRRKQEEEQRSMHNKIVDRITSFTGSMGSVYFHLVFFALWIAWNLGWLNLKPFDHSFILLGTTAAVEAIFLSTFVLISQNNMNEKADQRAELDLQISLLTEHEVTRIITVVNAIAKKAGLEHMINEEMEELSKDVHPEKVLDQLDSARAEKE